MKNYLLPAIKMTMIMLVLLCVVYFGIVYFFGKFTHGEGNGEIVMSKGKVVGYKTIGQKFTEDKYFWGRPSGVDYNAAGSAGSNKGPSNPDYIQIVKDRIDSFLVHNPGVSKKDIPAELVTASGSGLDPDITPAGAYVQVKRVAASRNISEEKVKALVDKHIRKNPIGPDVINVLALNVALEN
ncbi:MAG: potassium-transporting ATPase subunit KdpC [Flavitalea sp.]